MGKFGYIPDNIRIGDIEFRHAKSLYDVKYFEIVKWENNPLYQKENTDRYKYDEDRKMYRDLNFENTWIDPECFKRPECCYTIATFKDDEHNRISELKFCEDRPMKLDGIEFARFMKVAKLAYEELKEMWKWYDPYAEDTPDDTEDDGKQTEGE